MKSPDEVPSSEVKVTMVLADYAVVTEDKLTVIGGGWTITGAPTAPFGIGVIIEVPWNQTNQDHQFRFALTDIDGQPVEIDTPEGTQFVQFEGGFQVGRPPGVRPGSAIPIKSRSTAGRSRCPPAATTSGSSRSTDTSTRTGAFRSQRGRRRKPKWPRST
jgi:hypothetical protein